MAKVQFFTQKMIDAWANQGKVEFDGETLRVLSGKPGIYRLKPATMFLKLLEGEDKNRLVGRVVANDVLKNMGADVYLDSCIMGDIAYNVEPGFVVSNEPVPVLTAPGKSTEQDSRVEDPNDVSLADLIVKSLNKP